MVFLSPASRATEPWAAPGPPHPTADTGALGLGACWPGAGRRGLCRSPSVVSQTVFGNAFLDEPLGTKGKKSEGGGQERTPQVARKCSPSTLCAGEDTRWGMLTAPTEPPHDTVETVPGGQVPDVRSHFGEAG